MTRFTILEDPYLEQRIDVHLKHIVAEVTSRMQPVAILLRGSFGRGEGSVVASNGRLRFLSDYEIDVATFSPFHRSLFRELSRQLTTEFGVETGLRWVRPDYLSKDRIGPLPTGKAAITISLYEARYGSRILYGQDILETSPAIDPGSIQIESAAFLLLNRMAESLSYMEEIADPMGDRWLGYYWINKTTLACAESLLLLWGCYHYSYVERGRRFLTLAMDRLDFLGAEGAVLSDLVARATEFKLRPDLGLYPEAVHDAWQRIIPVCCKVFHYVAAQAFHLDYHHESEFPQRFIQRAVESSRTTPPLHQGALAALSLYKCLRVGRLPKALFSPFPISSRVYAVVPLMFASQTAGGEALPLLLAEIRKWLQAVCRTQAPASDLYSERETLRQQVLWVWKNFCYL